MTNRHRFNLSRRDMLKTAASGPTIPIVVPGGVHANPNSSGANDRLRIGMIGTGNRGTDMISIIFAGGSDAAGCRSRLRSAADGRFRKRNTRHISRNYRVQSLSRLSQNARRGKAGRGLRYYNDARPRVADHSCVPSRCRRLREKTDHTDDRERANAHPGGSPSPLPAGEPLGGPAGATRSDWKGRKGPCPQLQHAHRLPAPESAACARWTQLGHVVNQAPLYPYNPTLTTELSQWGLYSQFDGGGSSWGMTGTGAHAFDQIQWAIGKDHTSPIEIWTTEPDGANCPVVMRYSDGQVLEMMAEAHVGPRFGGIFIGNQGKVEINRNVIRSNPVEIAQAMPTFDNPYAGKDGTAHHIADWLDAIRTRREQNCPIETAHRHSVLCHLANIARQLRQKLRYNPKVDRFVENDEANNHPVVSRPRRKGYELPNL